GGGGFRGAAIGGGGFRGAAIRGGGFRSAALGGGFRGPAFRSGFVGARNFGFRPGFAPRVNRFAFARFHRFHRRRFFAFAAAPFVAGVGLYGAPAATTMATTKRSRARCVNNTARSWRHENARDAPSNLPRMVGACDG